MQKKTLFVLTFSIFFALACGIFQQPSAPNIDEIVQATFQALTAQAPSEIDTVLPPDPSATPLASTATAISTTGSIAGQLSYPSNFIPSMYVVAFNTNTNDYYFVVTMQNSTAYQIDNLPAGSYYIVAYTDDGSASAGGYSQAVLCGLLAECTDHGLIPVSVQAGEVTKGIDPSDFYAAPGTFPPLPLP